MIHFLQEPKIEKNKNKSTNAFTIFYLFCNCRKQINMIKKKSIESEYYQYKK